MRHIGIVALFAVISACGTEKSSEQTSGEVAVQNVIEDLPHSDPEAETGADVSATQPTPVAGVALAYNPADIPPCLSIYEGATKVRVERKQTRYGEHYALGYMVDAPLQNVVDFYMRTVREKGCRIDHIDSRPGIEQFTIYTAQSFNSGKSSSLEAIAINNGAGPIMVGSRGNWLNP